MTLIKSNVRIHLLTMSVLFAALLIFNKVILKSFDQAGSGLINNLNIIINPIGSFAILVLSYRSVSLMKQNAVKWSIRILMIVCCIFILFHIISILSSAQLSSNIDKYFDIFMVISKLIGYFSVAVLSYNVAILDCRNAIMWAVGAFFMPFLIPIILFVFSEEKIEADREPELMAYNNEKWGLSFDYPKDWEIVWENEPDGGWEIVVGVAGKPSRSGRAAVTVHVLQHAVINLHHENVAVYASGGPGALLELDRSPEEYNERCKRGLEKEFSGLQFISEETGTISGMISGTLVYRYELQQGTIWEKQINLFGTEVTYRLICEAPIEESEKIERFFNSIVENFEPFAGSE